MIIAKVQVQTMGLQPQLCDNCCLRCAATEAIHGSCRERKSACCTRIASSGWVGFNVVLVDSYCIVAVNGYEGLKWLMS